MPGECTRLRNRSGIAPAFSLPAPAHQPDAERTMDARPRRCPGTRPAMPTPIQFLPVFRRSELMAKALLWIVAVIFLIGLLVVFGVLDFIF
jgi:hypothetical protein